MERSLGGPLSKLFKDFYSMLNSGCHGKQMENFKNNVIKNYWADLKIVLYKWFVGDPLPRTKIVNRPPPPPCKAERGLQECPLSVKIVSEYGQEIPQTNRRQPHGTARKSRSTITRHQEDKLSKATSSLFPIKMIAKSQQQQNHRLRTDSSLSHRGA